MGINNLGNFIKTNAPNAIKPIKYKSLENKILAIDTSIILYQYLVAIKSSIEDFKTKDGKITSHINGILMRTLNFIKKKIKPIFVFDGKPPDIKAYTLEGRKTLKEASTILLNGDTILSKEDKIKHMKKSVHLSKEDMEECKEILNLIGIPVIQAKGEADVDCANLVKHDIAYGVISEDMDMLTFGSSKLIRGISKESNLKEYDLATLLKELNLTYEQFVDLCILLGCDYCKTIHGIGIKRALSLIEKHKSIDNLVDKYDIPKNYKIVRNYFMDTIDYDNDINKYNFIWNKPDLVGLENILLNKYEFNKDNVEKIITELRDGYYSVICGINKTAKTIIKKINPNKIFI